MATRPNTINREEIGHLCDRLEARARSRLSTLEPEACRDMSLAALILRRALAIGFPVSPIDLNETAATADALTRVAMLRKMTVLIVDEENQAMTPAMAATIARTVAAVAG